MRFYAFHRIELRDRLLLTAMIERAARRLEQEWMPGETDLAECVFYRGEAPATLSTGAALVRVGSLADVNTPQTLRFPPRVSEVVTVLDAIDHQRSRATAPETGDASWLKLVEDVQRLLAEGRPAALVNASGSGWVMEPADRRYMAYGPFEIAPKVLLESSAEQWSLVDAPQTHVQARRPLENLLWFLGIAAGGEGVMTTIGPESLLSMRVWPYLLARAPRKYSELAKQLRQGDRSAMDLQIATSASMNEVAAFINACSLCGFLKPADKPRPLRNQERLPAPVDFAPTPPTQQRFTRFLGAIRHALGMPA